MIDKFHFSDQDDDCIDVEVWKDGYITLSINKAMSVELPRLQADRLTTYLTRAGYGAAPLSPVSTTFWLGADA